MTSLVLGDDHTVFLDAISVVLERRGYWVTVARTLPETAERVRRLRPDVCLLDRHFAEDNGIEVIPTLIATSPNTKVLVLSANPEAGGVARALHLGASGYLHKTRGLPALIAAMSRAISGEVVVDVPGASARAMPQDEVQRLASYLTARERECLALLVDGLDTAMIARRLSVSPATIRTHIQSVLTKLGVHSRLEAASLAVRHQLVEEKGRVFDRARRPADSRVE